ncbi:hypothetical protein BN938_0967 [Mucinivorans hirudinis]|uniref:Uncharacterized protein n=1 Tax=Mucinivorans hirudinis TaxID=1433126 RepID=A0A060R767_9BACT|nr:hypothetical protein BN938_0967 [Mucinivorans hirudinis]
MVKSILLKSSGFLKKNIAGCIDLLKIIIFVNNSRATFAPA